MTASLPKSRLEAIEKVLSQRHQTLKIIEGPADLEQIPRYILGGPVEHAPWEQVQQVLKQDGKILWVVNTVDRCVDFIGQAKAHGFKPLPYHSRYKYCDRIKKHNAVIEAFKAKGATLAMTTQVCEVSLNISADLLITDLAPAPALIQRLGRLNRRVTAQDPGSPKTGLLLTPPSPRPYGAQDMGLVTEWVHRLGAGPVSQATLAQAFESLSQEEASPVKSAWMEGGPFSRQQPLREAEATIPIIRAEDEPLCVDREKRPIAKEITQYSIPMLLGPVAREIGQWKRLSFVFVAPAGKISYSEELGAKWSK